jgi:hypothetical protein
VARRKADGDINRTAPLCRRSALRKVAAHRWQRGTCNLGVWTTGFANVGGFDDFELGLRGLPQRRLLNAGGAGRGGSRRCASPGHIGNSQQHRAQLTAAAASIRRDTPVLGLPAVSS